MCTLGCEQTTCVHWGVNKQHVYIGVWTNNGYIGVDKRSLLTVSQITVYTGRTFGFTSMATSVRQQVSAHHIYGDVCPPAGVCTSHLWRRLSASRCLHITSMATSVRQQVSAHHIYGDVCPPTGVYTSRGFVTNWISRLPSPLKLPPFCVLLWRRETNI
ncbi:hypothetical protein ACOMHN_030624 [Nucella lapillus]